LRTGTKHPLSRPEAWKLDAFSDAKSISARKLRLAGDMQKSQAIAE
jgi:hypothetical protein